MAHTLLVDHRPFRRSRAPKKQTGSDREHCLSAIMCGASRELSHGISFSHAHPFAQTTSCLIHFTLNASASHKGNNTPRYAVPGWWITPLRHRRVPQKKCDNTSCCLRKQRDRVYSECTFFRGTRGAEHGEAGIEGALFFRLFLLGEQKKWPRLSRVAAGETEPRKRAILACGCENPLQPALTVVITYFYRVMIGRPHRG